jgi:hypothetical protein
MTRIVQPEGTKGSLKWTQKLINDHPSLINDKLASLISLQSGEQIEWVSPLSKDEYAEYRDSTFLKKIGVTLSNRSLESFWPKRGPQWDALAKTNKGKVILVEAKAHIDEIISPPTQASAKSRAKIKASIDETKAYLGVEAGVDWLSTFYQYTNRLAHLYLLRELNGIDCYLVFLCFVNDPEMNGPQTDREWQGALKVINAALGLKRHKLLNYMHDVFIDVKNI